MNCKNCEYSISDYVYKKIVCNLTGFTCYYITTDDNPENDNEKLYPQPSFCPLISISG